MIKFLKYKQKNDSMIGVNKQQQSAGYTLIEMMVAITIFAIAFVAIGAIFLSYSLAQTRASSGQRLLNESNFLFETVAREIRMNAIDYSCPFADPATTINYICLKKTDGTVEHVKFENKQILVCKQPTALDCAGPTNWISLTPAFVTVSSAKFYTYPTADPNAIDVADAQLFQPITTILMSVATGQGRAYQTYDFQTAVSSRVYGQ